MLVKQQTYWIILFVFCVLTALLALEYLPIAWFDEVMDFEPVARWFQNGEHASIAWPLQDCGKSCYVNLPFREFPHFIALLIFGPSLWGLRFVFLFFTVLAAIGFWKVLKELKLPISLCFFLSFMLFLDRGTLEMMRGSRPEVLEMALLAWSFYYLLREKYFVSSTILLALAWVHPAFWIIAVGLWIYSFFQASTKTRLLNSLLVLVSFIGFTWFIEGDFNLFYKQFSMSAMAHVADYSWGRKFLEHLSMRYLKFWRIEFWWMFIFIGSHIWIFTQWKKVNLLTKYVLLIVVLTSVYWFLLLLPNYRYCVALNTALLFLVVNIKPEFIRKFQHKGVQIGMLAILFVPFMGRAFVAGIQNEERNPDRVLAWLEKELPKKNTLVIGESIASYWSIKNPSTKFAHDTQPQNAKFANFDQVYYLSKSKKLPVFANYEVIQIERILGFPLRGSTYANLSLYKIENQKTFDSIVAKGMRYNYFYDK